MQEDKQDRPLMYFERSSGFPGYRCQKCGKWEYLQDAMNHKCEEKK